LFETSAQVKDLSLFSLFLKKLFKLERFFRNFSSSSDFHGEIFFGNVFQSKIIFTLSTVVILSKVVNNSPKKSQITAHFNSQLKNSKSLISSINILSNENIEYINLKKFTFQTFILNTPHSIDKC
jgi:hypothetical protein